VETGGAGLGDAGGVGVLVVAGEGVARRVAEGGGEGATRALGEAFGVDAGVELEPHAARLDSSAATTAAPHVVLTPSSSGAVS